MALKSLSVGLTTLPCKKLFDQDLHTKPRPRNNRKTNRNQKLKFFLFYIERKNPVQTEIGFILSKGSKEIQNEMMEKYRKQPYLMVSVKMTTA